MPKRADAIASIREHVSRVEFIAFTARWDRSLAKSTIMLWRQAEPPILSDVDAEFLIEELGLQDA